MDGLKWNVGDVQIFQILELEAGQQIQGIIREATPENIQKIPWLYPHFADAAGKLKASVQGFLVRSNNKNILIDTGVGNHKARTDVPEWADLRTKFLRNLDAIGIGPSDVDIVACTHLHMDHVGWNTSLEERRWVPTFPNAKYIFVREEYEYWEQQPEVEFADDRAAFQDSVSPIVEAGLAELVDLDHTIDGNVRFIPAPGHTPSHISVSIVSKSDSAIITGDILYHPCQIARPDWTTNADPEPEKALETRWRILDQIAETRTLLIGSHFANPVAGRVLRYEDNFILDVGVDEAQGKAN